MLELAYVREHFDQVRKGLESRGFPLGELDNFLQLDQQRRKAITDVEALKAERNRANAEIGRLKKEGKDASAVMEQMKQVAARTKELDAQAEALDQQLRELLLRIPNLPHQSVPVGRTPGDNV